MNLAPSKMNVTAQTTRRRYVLSQPCVPKDLDIPAPLLKNLAEAELALVQTEVNACLHVRESIQRFDNFALNEQALQAPVAPLWHRLGEASVSRCHPTEQGIPWRSDMEQRTLDSRCEALLLSLEQPVPDAFVAELLMICAMVKGLPLTNLRTNGVELAGDKNGWSWQFPDSHGISKCLSALHGALRQRRFSNAIVDATVAYGILNWMHPVGDGNGRTSRMVFNAILRRAGMPKDHYVPIKEINHLARGGHEVRLRYTVAAGDWEELLEYFVNAIALYKVLLHQEVTPAESRMW